MFFSVRIVLQLSLLGHKPCLKMHQNTSFPPTDIILNHTPEATSPDFTPFASFGYSTAHPIPLHFKTWRRLWMKYFELVELTTTGTPHATAAEPSVYENSLISSPRKQYVTMHTESLKTGSHRAHVYTLLTWLSYQNNSDLYIVVNCVYHLSDNKVSCI